MELKYGRPACGIDEFSGSNRTFMELKLKNRITKVLGEVSSNRTFMELKFLLVLF